VALPTIAAAHYAPMPLLLSAGQQLIDISCQLGTQQQTHSSGVQRANDGMTDRWTLTSTQTVLRILFEQCQ